MHHIFFRRRRFSHFLKEIVVSIFNFAQTEHRVDDQILNFFPDHLGGRFALDFGVALVGHVDMVIQNGLGRVAHVAEVARKPKCCRLVTVLNVHVPIKRRFS